MFLPLVFCVLYLQYDKQIFIFMLFTVTHYTIVHFTTASMTLWLGCNQLMIRQSLSLLVMSMLITLSGWSEFPSFLRSQSPRNLLTTDVPGIVDVVVGTPLCTSDHCFVSCVTCVLRVEQSVPEYNVRSIVFLQHCSNWNSVHIAVRSFKWSTVLKSAVPLVEFDLAIG